MLHPHGPHPAGTWCWSRSVLLGGRATRRPHILPVARLLAGFRSAVQGVCLLTAVLAGWHR